MANPAIDSCIQCPFFVKQDMAYISCESCVPGAKQTFIFKNTDKKEQYIRDVCCVNHGKKCLHYRSMMILYERGVLNGLS